MIKINLEIFIRDKVEHYYFNKDLNCAATVLIIFSELFKIELSDQVISSATGMNGAGKFGAQCGLLEGTLMFLGILGKELKYTKENITEICYDFTKNFEGEYESLLCSRLRPEGFPKDKEIHRCEGLTKVELKFAVEYIENFYNIKSIFFNEN